jgi:hypothetical protein
MACALVEPPCPPAREHRPAEQGGRLALRDPPPGVEAEREIPAALELERLGADHLVDGVEEALEHTRDVGAPHAAERLDEEPVAGEDRDRVAPDRAGRGRAAAHLPEVDDVVVQQRRRVDELDRGRKLVGARVRATAKLGREHHAHRPQALAAERDEVASAAVDRAGLAGAEAGVEAALELGHVELHEARELREALAEGVELLSTAEGLEAGEHGAGLRARSGGGQGQVGHGNLRGCGRRSFRKL